MSEIPAGKAPPPAVNVACPLFRPGYARGSPVVDPLLPARARGPLTPVPVPVAFPVSAAPLPVARCPARWPARCFWCTSQQERQLLFFPRALPDTAKCVQLLPALTILL